MDTLQLQGIPFAPGYAQGQLQRHITESVSDTILLAFQHELSYVAGHRPAGLIVVDGALFSHAMIQLLSLDIPIIIIREKEANQFSNGLFVEIDGSSGSIKQLESPYAHNYRSPPEPQFAKPVQSADAVDVSICASVSSVESTTKALRYGATSIGLVRSEFLQTEHIHEPDSSFYLRVFSELCEAARPLSVNIRLLDIASDKQATWAPDINGMQGTLGLQGARLYDFEAIRRVVVAQVSALDQLQSHFHLKLIIPYVGSPGEFRRWQKNILELMGKPIPIGAMLETPATVLNINNWLDLADFVSIGTNDLIQCLYGDDRELHSVQRYLNPYSPILLRVLQQAARDAGDNIKRVQLCGLLAQFPGILPGMHPPKWL